MRVGSLCTGIAGLELGLRYAGVDTEPVFVSDIDPGANQWLAATMPDVPNLGDFTAYDELPEVDLITAGFPCQPFSTAGNRQGLTDERYLFDDIARLTGRMGTRPLLFLENVPGLLTANDGNAVGRLVHELAAIGYHITWGTLPAAAVGAPHRRLRWWGLAYPADTDGPSRQTRSRSRLVGQRLRPQPVGHSAHHYGPFLDAVQRWERILGRSAPPPVDEKRCLNSEFVEWMMGYPEGWVTDVLTRRNQSLHALGNAVVPQCAAAAFTQLRTRLCT